MKEYIEESMEESMKESAKESVKKPIKETKDLTQLAILWNTSALFIFILILCGNYLAALLPCRVQDFIEHNMYMRHFIGYMTMLFFVILTLPDLFVQNMLQASIGLYVFFIFLSKTYWKIWVFIMIIFSIIFVVNTMYNVRKLKAKKEEKTYNEVNKEANKAIFSSYGEILEKLYDDHMPKLRTAVIILILSLTIFGFLVYLGNKKREFGKKFNMIRFLFGNPVCKFSTPPIKSYMEEIKYVFK